MILSDVSVKRPIFAVVLSLLLVAFGILSFQGLPVRELPDIDVPIVNVQTVYPGAAATVVESRITRPVEDAVSGIEGIRSITSSSQDGASSVVVELVSSRDIDAAANDVREAVSRSLTFLPEEADPPQVFKVDADSDPNLWFSLTSDVLNQMQLTDYADRNIVDRFSTVEGVARAIIGGERRYSMRIWLDRQKMAARNLTVADIENALRTENVEIPAGDIETEARNFTVRMERAYKTPDDFMGLVIAEGTDGYLIRLGDVADVELGPTEIRGEFRTNGQAMIGIGVQKQSKANSLQVAQDAIVEAERIAETLPPSMEFYPAWDSSIFISAAIDEVYFTLFLAVALVVFVIYLFLGNIKAALVPSVTVPVCLIATFIALGVAGFSINLLTLLALVLAIGLVVDDSIVVLENIYRRVEEGEPALLAAYRGSRQVAFAVIATTLVLIGVFVPVAFLEGNVGRLFSELAVTLAAAVAFSSFVALSLSPMMCSKLLSRRAKKSWLTLRMEHFFSWLSDAYRRSLQIAFTNKLALIVILLGALVLSFGLLRQIPGEFTPQEDRGGFFVIMRGPEGTSFELMREEVLKVEERLVEGVEEGFLKRVMVIAPGFRQSGRAYNTGNAILFLQDWEERDKTPDEIRNWIFGQIADITSISVFPIEFSTGGGTGNPIDIAIGGAEYSDFPRFRDTLESALSDYAGITNLQFDYRETKPQMQIDVDIDRAADLGVSVQSVGRALETFLGGRRVTTFIDRGEEYDVILRADDENRSDAADISNTYVRSDTTGQLVPLSSVVTIREVAAASSLNRYNRIRAMTLTASLAEGYTMGPVLDHIENVIQTELPDSLGIDYKGQSREFKDAGTAVLFTFLLALMVVFLILAAQFESFIHPFVIMLTVPLAVAGGLLGLWLTDGTMNIYSQVGMVILIGIAAKNGILIVEFANQIRDKGKSVEEAIIEACGVRLRPILMTALSTAIGTMPLVLATGPGSASRASIGIVIVFGVSFATLFTLYIVPVVYRMMAPYTSPTGTITRRLRELQKEFSSDRARGKDKQPAE